MRILLFVLAIASFFSLRAQSPLVPGYLNYGQPQPIDFEHFSGDPAHINSKWQLLKYGSLSAGYGFYPGGNLYQVSAPVGLQLNHALNKNLYAFAGLSIAPAYTQLSQSFMNPGFNKSYPVNNLMTTNGFGMYSRAEMGLMYVNDQKTFSISGSIGVERSSYPLFYPTNQRDTKRPQSIGQSRQ